MAGIYLHIPFCKQQCSYCDFHFSTTFQAYRSRMIQAMLAEIVARKEEVKEPVETIYFGGGTPSLLLEEELRQLLEKVGESFDLIQTPEITLEANPDDCSEENLKVWKSLGVNRLSIGLQSFKPSDLDWMHRAHTSEEALACVARARKFGFDRITVDLMYGLPNLSIDEWEAHLATVLDMGIQHISAYCLTVEKKTPLHKRVQEHDVDVPGEEVQSEQFLKMIEVLENAGFRQYEISNFALQGHESRHNSAYWKGVPYLGIGPSAHSFSGDVRRWNIANNQRYMQGVEKKVDYFETELLSPANRFNELLMTGLRLADGVERRQLEVLHPIPVAFEQKISEFTALGWLSPAQDRFQLTREGRLRADWIASELFCV